MGLPSGRRAGQGVLGAEPHGAASSAVLGPSAPAPARYAPRESGQVCVGV